MVRRHNPGNMHLQVKSTTGTYHSSTLEWAPLSLMLILIGTLPFIYDLALALGLAR